MINDLKPYSAMKDSCAAWLGNVPEHWSLRRTKTILHERVEKGFPDEPLLAATQTKGVVRKDQYENRTVLALKDLHLLKLVRVGDFVISLRSFQGGIEFAREQGIISPAYTVLYPAKPEEQKFLASLFKSKPYVENLSLFVTGIRQGQNIDYEKLSRSEIPVPPLPEQAAIVSFLDYTDRRIWRYLRAKQKLIKLLQEQKRAIIHHAVTGQIDVSTGEPYSVYKDSGVSWLGNIPKHWHVNIVKRQFRVDLGKMLNSKAESANSDMASYLNAANIHWEKIKVDKINSMAFTPKQKEHYRLKKHDLLVTEGGATVGRSVIWNDELPECYFQNSLNRIRSIRALSTEYLYYWMFYVTMSGLIEAIADSATFGHLTNEKLCRLPLTVPSKKEAESITSYLKCEFARIDAVEQEILENIKLLREYRTRLIADVVTGKLDVREAAANLPDEVKEEADAEELEDVSEIIEEDPESETEDELLSDPV